MPLLFTQTHPSTAEPLSLRYRLHKALVQTRPGRDLGVQHASSMTNFDFCPRQRRLQIVRGHQPKPERVQAAARVTHDFGYAVQDLVTGWAAEAGIAFGNWECLGCRHLHFMQYRPGVCASCKSEGHFRYRERRFLSQVSGLSCGVDLMVSDLGQKLKIVEIKSVMKEDFVKLIGPYAEHRLRTNLYMRIVSESNDEDRDKIDQTSGLVFYVCKGGFVKDTEVMGWKLGDLGFTPFKEYPVTRNDSETESIHKLNVAYREAHKNGVMPAGICLSAFDNQGKFCPVHADCFSGKFPVGEPIK